MLCQQNRDRRVESSPSAFSTVEPGSGPQAAASSLLNNPVAWSTADPYYRCMFKDVLTRQQQEEALLFATVAVICAVIAAPFVLAVKALQFGCRVADRTIIAVLTFL